MSNAPSRAAEMERLRREGMAAHVSKEKAEQEAREAALKSAPSQKIDDLFPNMFSGVHLHDEIIEDTVIAPPQPTPGMFYGIVGDVARIAADGTETNPVAAATAYLSFLGANVGRDTFLLINNTYLTTHGFLRCILAVLGAVARAILNSLPNAFENALKRVTVAC